MTADLSMLEQQLRPIIGHESCHLVVASDLIPPREEGIAEAPG
jgi:hypothetical protein